MRSKVLKCVYEDFDKKCKLYLNGDLERFKSDINDIELNLEAYDTDYINDLKIDIENIENILNKVPPII
jgi:hypothetical protein